MPRFIAVIILSCILLSACQKPSTAPTEGIFSTEQPSVDSDYWVDHSRRFVRAGTVETALAETRAETVKWDCPWPGTPEKDHRDEKFYTFREVLSATAGLKWSPHTWETASDRYILNYTTLGFYDMVLDDSGSGFCFVPEMAAEPPQDVTADFTGRFGIAPGDTARAWRIRLNPAACWDNGEPIDADTYVYSYQQLLDGRMHNRRADSLYAGEFAIVGAQDYLYGKISWEDVGILKTGEHELVLITTAPIADPDFYVPYQLTATFLVYEPLWEACKTYFDKDGQEVTADSAHIATISTNYCTSLETSISYGPYRLTYFELDKQITLQRNDRWYGYRDGRHDGQYQTDAISCQIIASHATALLAFLGGQLDTIDLQAEDMDRYATSHAVRYHPESYTTKLSFNTDPEALAKRGNQILSNAHFRKALSLAIDRTRFAAGYTSAGAPGYGLLSSLYVHDPYTRDAYRQAEGAKHALVQLYGLDMAKYGSLENAYRAITGYDPAYARSLMQLAYEESVENGLYDGVSPIRLQLCVYQGQDIYVQMFHFLQDALALCCQGTDLEGKVTLEMAVDADYYATMESGLTDMIFSTWGGSAYDPYGVLYQCYCDKGVAESPNQHEYGFDAGKVTVEMTIDGIPVTASLQDWARWCSGDSAVEIPSLLSFRSYDADTRCRIYANLEYAYLSQYATTPLYERNAAMLVSDKGNWPAKTYIEPVAYGGIRFYHYAYDDTAWEAVKGQLQY